MKTIRFAHLVILSMLLSMVGQVHVYMQEIEDTGKKGGKILYLSRENFFLEF